MYRGLILGVLRWSLALARMGLDHCPWKIVEIIKLKSVNLSAFWVS